MILELFTGLTSGVRWRSPLGEDLALIPAPLSSILRSFYFGTCESGVTPSATPV